MPGQIIVLHPDELHDGAAGTEDGLSYRMLYLEPALLQAALPRGFAHLPFVRDPVLTDPHFRKTLSLLWPISTARSSLQRDAFIPRRRMRSAAFRFTAFAGRARHDGREPRS